MTAVQWGFMFLVPLVVYAGLLLTFAVLDAGGTTQRAIATTLAGGLMVYLSGRLAAGFAPARRRHVALAVATAPALPFLFVLYAGYPYPVWLRLVAALVMACAALAAYAQRKPVNLAHFNCYYGEKGNYSQHEARCRNAFALNAAAIAQTNRREYESALESFYKALAAFHELATEDKARREYYAAGYHLACEARTWLKIAEAQELNGLDTVAAFNALQQALALQESIRQGEPARCEPRLHLRALPAFRTDKAETLKAIGDVLKSRGEYAQALQSYERALREHGGNAESVKNSIVRVKALLATPGTAPRA